MAPFWAAEESYAPEVAFAFDEELPERLHAANRKVPVLATGAGHGAGVLAGELPTVTRFVRNPTGVSHSPAETAADGLPPMTAVREWKPWRLSSPPWPPLRAT